jgi:hypothetical protein
MMLYSITHGTVPKQFANPKKNVFNHPKCRISISQKKDFHHRTYGFNVIYPLDDLHMPCFSYAFDKIDSLAQVQCERIRPLPTWELLNDWETLVLS